MIGLDTMARHMGEPLAELVGGGTAFRSVPANMLDRRGGAHAIAVEIKPWQAAEKWKPSRDSRDSHGTRRHLEAKSGRLAVGSHSGCPGPVAEPGR